MIKKIIFVLLATASISFAQVKEKIEVPYIAFPIKMGKHFDVVQANCLTCHSFGYVLNQGQQSKKFWEEKVHKMVNAFKAPISKEDQKSIVEYLFSEYGNGKEE